MKKKICELKPHEIRAICDSNKCDAYSIPVFMNTYIDIDDGEQYKSCNGCTYYDSLMGYCKKHKTKKKGYDTCPQFKEEEL